MTACDDCLRRADLIAALAGRLQIEFKQRSAPSRVLALPDEGLLEIGDIDVRARYRRFDAPAARARASAVGLKTVCRCRDDYPERLRDLADPPAVLHVLGDIGAVNVADGVAVVGARRASGYGLGIADALGRGLSAAGVPVISGLALGIDSAAHQGALSAGSPAALGLASRIETAAQANQAGRAEDLSATLRRRPAGNEADLSVSLAADDVDRAASFAADDVDRAAAFAADDVDRSASFAGDEADRSASFAADEAGLSTSFAGDEADRCASFAADEAGLTASFAAVEADLLTAVSAPRGHARWKPARPVAVLAGSAHKAYPAGGWRVHAGVAARGAVVSELPPGAEAQRWCFVARNRIIAALSAVTVVVQATERSGSLTTADFAAELGRVVAAVPGSVTSRLSGGVHALIQAGAPLVRGTEDVLELLAAETGQAFDIPEPPPVALAPRLRALLSAVEDGRGSLGELAGTPEEARDALAGLGELERLGLVRRGFGGRWERAA
jgi:predicted Rossmann fold nucleotide-binding protein DprA/Smf involved in DNA uptake